MPDVITDRRITQDEAGQLMAPMELDLLSLFKVMEQDILTGLEDFEGTPEEYIDRVVKNISGMGESEVYKGKPLPPGTRRKRTDGIYVKQPDGTWSKETEKKPGKEKKLFEKASPEMLGKIKNKIKTDRKLRQLNLELNNFDAQGNYVLYHGTNEKNMNSILEQGLNPLSEMAYSYTTTTNPEVAAKFAIGRSGNKVLEIKIPFEDLKKYLFPGKKLSPFDNLKDTEHALKATVDKKHIKELEGNIMNKSIQKVCKLNSKQGIFKSLNVILKRIIDSIK